MAATAAPDPSPRNHDGRTPERASTVNTTLTPDKARAAVENPEYAAFARRILRAYAPRRRWRHRVSGLHG